MSIPVRRLLLYGVLLCMTVSALAYDMHFDGKALESEHFQRMAANGQIHIDQRDPPTRPTHLQRREEIASSVVSQVESTTATTSSSPSVTVIATPLPKPFDTSLGNNFTNPSCPDFFTTFLSNTTFESCVPISLMLQNSMSFFRAERSPSLLSETLDAGCNAPLSICSPLMANLAAELISDSNCGTDYTEQNPLVTQAYAGLMAYEPLFKATCLKDSATNSYCFSDAITNSSNSADAYPYYTAVGINLPKGSSPTCSQCLKDTMQIFGQYAKNEAQPLAGTYMNCAKQVDNGCGSTFADTAIKVGSVASTSGAGMVSSSMLTVLGFFILLVI